jgi:DNA-binding transcriptional LysR family regulator
MSLLPDLTYFFLLRQPDLVSVPLAPKGISRPIHIIWRKDKPLSIAAQAMLEVFRERKPTDRKYSRGKTRTPIPVNL